MDGTPVASEYTEHITDADLRFLAGVAGAPAGHAEAEAARLRRDPDAVAALLADPRAFEAVFGAASAGEPVLASPFLAFAVAVHRAAADLASVGYVPERSLARQRVPVFDAPELRDFLGSDARRLFLAELLAPFTRVASGRYRVTSGGRSRTRRFSELDPVPLAGLLDAVPEQSRPGVYRRLRDVAPFLSGAFPAYVPGPPLVPGAPPRLPRGPPGPPAQ